MNEIEKQPRKPVEKPLRFSCPELYDQLLEELWERNIHFYDVQASIQEKENGSEVILRFGEDFTQSTRCFFAREALQPKNEEVTNFFQTSTQSCQRAIVGDYYKMMKP